MREETVSHLSKVLQEIKFSCIQSLLLHVASTAGFKHWLFTLVPHNMLLIKSIFQILWGALRKISNVSPNWIWGSGMEDRKNHSSCLQWKIQFPTHTACALPIQLSTFSILCRNLSRLDNPDIVAKQKKARMDKKPEGHEPLVPIAALWIIPPTHRSGAMKSYTSIVSRLPQSNEVTNEEVSIKFKKN